MRRSLLLHPQSRCAAVRSIEVEIGRPFPRVLNLRYIASGNIAAIAAHTAGEIVRSDELWRHTCFEAFVREQSAAPYFEFNFAPSRQWAAYAFESERRGMRVAAEITELNIEVRKDPEVLELRAELFLNRVVELPARAGWSLALSAVIEETNGNKSYWALAHPKATPDFHHSDCFALELPSALQS